ncbi:MAG: DUF433 domain-containing protein [Dehalococcoidia bacterium]|nr:DUF433 domain-containing protein [Dehalococcoidia bacterium]
MRPTHLSKGIYDPPSAARLLRAGRMAHETYPVSSRTLIRWIRSGLATPGLANVDGQAMVLSFEDLISLRVIAALRAAGVSWTAIRKAEKWLRETTGYDRPFAREELWTSSSAIFVRFRKLIVEASRSGQLAMDILEQHLLPLNGIEFANNVASSWRLADGVVIDPLVQFGEPCVEGTRIPVRSVLSLLDAGDPPELVQQSYRLTDCAMKSVRAWAKLGAAA